MGIRKGFMKKLEDLRKKIQKHDVTIGVIGLGYVGLPVTCMFAKAGFSVIGLDIKPDRIAMINAGKCPIEGEEPGLADLLREVVASKRLRATTDYEHLRQADIVLIDVETPVDESHCPQYVALRAACKSLARVMKDQLLVIVESTIAPGTIDRVVRPLIEEFSGKTSNTDFYLGACPERVMPGKLLANLRKMSRVCGGSTPEVASVMVDLYRNIVEVDLDTADPVTAELVKTTENAYRDVQIAFANEVALICEKNGADVWRVRELVNKSPGRNMHFPGAGVGGHCIPKDPWLLAYSVADFDMQLHLIPAARDVNNQMPIHVGQMLETALDEQGISLSEARILVMGYAYLENSDDTRNSPSEALCAWLVAQGAQVVIHDPWVKEYQGDLLETADGCDAAVLMVAHQEYKDLSLNHLAKALKFAVLVDGRNMISTEAAAAAGFVVRAVGRG